VKRARRSISVRADTYAAARRYCEEHSVSLSDLVERHLRPLVGLPDAATAPRQPRPPRAPATVAAPAAPPARASNRGRAPDGMRGKDMHNALAILGVAQARARARDLERQRTSPGPIVQPGRDVPPPPKVSARDIIPARPVNPALPVLL
jgi:hypothetical protein